MPNKPADANRREKEKDSFSIGKLLFTGLWILLLGTYLFAALLDCFIDLEPIEAKNGDIIQVVQTTPTPKPQIAGTSGFQPRISPTPIPKPKTIVITPTPIPVTVYVTKSGRKYHRGSCGYLSRSKIPISLTEAKKEGYTPCSRCHPPLYDTGYTEAKSKEKITYILNTATGRFHNPTCRVADRISGAYREEYTGTRSNLISAGYEPCQACNP